MKKWANQITNFEIYPFCTFQILGVIKLIKKRTYKSGSIVKTNMKKQGEGGQKLGNLGERAF